MTDEQLRDKLADEYQAPLHPAWAGEQNEAFKAGWDAARANSPKSVSNLLGWALKAATDTYKELKTKSKALRQVKVQNQDIDKAAVKTGPLQDKSEQLYAQNKQLWIDLDDLRQAMRKEVALLLEQLEWSLKNEKQYQEELKASLKRENELRAEVERLTKQAQDQHFFERQAVLYQNRLNAAAEKLAEALNKAAEYADKDDCNGEAGNIAKEALAEYRKAYPKGAK